MSETTISNIRPEGARFEGPANPVAGQTARGSPVETSPAGERHESKSVPADSPAHASVRTPEEIHLQFKVNPDTGDVVILLVDQSSQEIIREIPPEELAGLANLGRNNLIDKFA